MARTAYIEDNFQYPQVIQSLPNTIADHAAANSFKRQTTRTSAMHPARVGDAVDPCCGC